MSLPKFAYLTPKSLKEASALLAECGEKARLMAGGTDLLIRLRHRAVSPDYVIGLRHLPGLDRVTFDRDHGLTIGALARLSAVADSPDVIRDYLALSQAAGQTATVQIRNMGTVAGNICNAAPSADTAGPLLVFGAEAVIVHPGGERILPLAEFFRGPGLTALETGEIVREIRLPPPGPGAGSDYQKLSARSKVDIAAVSVACFVRVDQEGRAETVRLALGAVAPVPLRARRAEKILAGQKPSDELLAQAGAAAADECSPISDVRSSAAYRRKMVEILTVRALRNSLNRAAESLTGCAQ